MSTGLRLPYKINLPKEYQEVEYLQSTGTQYLDLGFNGSEKTDIELVFSSQETLPTKGFFGDYNASSGVFCLEAQTMTGSSGGTSVYYGLSSYVQIASTKSFDKMKLKIDGTSVYVDDVLKGTITRNVATSAYNFLLFTLRVGTAVTNYCSNMTCYSCKIWESGTLIRNLVPCYRRSDNVAGMYDTVNGVFYINQGSGTFTIGSDVKKNLRLMYALNIPSEYQELDFIESTGTQYIDTGFPFVLDTDTITIEYENTSTVANRWVFGYYDSSSGSNIGYSSATLTVLRVWLGNKYGNMTPEQQYDSKHTGVFSSAGAYNDGTLLTVAGTYSSNSNIYIFGVNNRGSIAYGYTKIWSYKQTRSGVDLIHLIPAKRKSDNVVGMYDKVSGEFFTNAGTGTFTAGNEKNNLRLLYTI